MSDVQLPPEGEVVLVWRRGTHPALPQRGIVVDGVIRFYFGGGQHGAPLDDCIAWAHPSHAKAATRLVEALTPSADTKAAYHGEFSWEERSDTHLDNTTRTVPWTTVKEIMKAIRNRAGLD